MQTLDKRSSQNNADAIRYVREILNASTVRLNGDGTHQKQGPIGEKRILCGDGNDSGGSIKSKLSVCKVRFYDVDDALLLSVNVDVKH